MSAFFVFCEWNDESLIFHNYMITYTQDNFEHNNVYESGHLSDWDHVICTITAQPCGCYMTMTDSKMTICRSILLMLVTVCRCILSAHCVKLVSCCLALQPSSAGAGPVVGGILAVVVIIGVCAIIIYLVIRRRRGIKTFLLPEDY